MEGEVKEEKLPTGFRFHPTDEELITCYLVNKISDSNFTGKAIADVDLNKCEPWDLPGKAKMGEKEWYFFCLRDRKYPTGVRTNRATNTGYWKTTGKDKEIYNSVSSELVGMKKTLVFYKGRAPRGEKSNWVIHEYRIHSKSSYRTATKDEWVVCRVFQKSIGMKKYTSNHSRAIPTYNLDIGPSAMPTQMMQQADIQFPMGRNNMSYADIQEFARVFRAGPSTINLPMQSQAHYAPVGGGGGGGGGNHFTISGLNINRGGAMETSTHPILRTMLPHPPAMTQQDLLAIQNEAAGFGADMNPANTMSNNRFMPLDHSADLDNYWPAY